MLEIVHFLLLVIHIVIYFVIKVSFDVKLLSTTTTDKTKVN